MSPTNNAARHVSAAIASLFALCAVSANAAAQTTYTIQDVASAATCGVTTIDDNGVVIGQCDQAAVVWRSGLAQSLGKLTGGNYSVATAINGFGVVVGDGDTGNFRPQSWVSTPAGLVNIFPNNGGNTHALFIADNGVIGGFYTKSLSGNTSAWRGAFWTPDPKDPRKYRTTDLPALAGAIDPKTSSSIPWAFNKQGQAAGWDVNDVIGQHAVLWNSDAVHSIVDLGTYPGDWSSIAWGMNDLGYVVGDSHPPAGSRAVMWTNDAAHTAIELPLLAGDNYGSAQKINNLGHILGTSAYAVPGTWNVGQSRPVVWRDGGVFELQAVLDPVTGTGWTITSATGINNLGQITAYAVHNAEVRIVVLTPAR